jgi:hypothetical protein
LIEKIRKVTIEFEDGSTEEFDIDPPAGFLREGYTYEQNCEGSDKVTAILHTFEIYWCHRKENGSALDFRPSKTRR